MPSRPPNLKPKAKRKAWVRNPQKPDNRIRGRRGVALRKARLAAEPLCRHCKDEGRITPSTVPDHIVPLAYGGEDIDSNIQCLCEYHHALKTAADTAADAGAVRHPNWLNPSAIPLTIVAGPPCAGKTTYVEDHASRDDQVICLDTIMMRIKPGYRHWSGTLDPLLLNKAIRVRNAMLGKLDRAVGGRAWFIVSAPTKAEREWWQSMLGGELVVLHPGVDECKRRAIRRGTPQAIDGIDRWERASRGDWKPAGRRSGWGSET